MRKSILILDENGNESTWAIQRWWIYETGPLDYWEGWTKIRSNDPGLKGALKALRESSSGSLLHWEGDISKGPYRLMLPIPASPMFVWLPVYALSQENNGSTFIISPMELPWCAGH